MFVYDWFTSVEQILVPVCDTCNMCYSRFNWITDNAQTFTKTT